MEYTKFSTFPVERLLEEGSVGNFAGCDFITLDNKIHPVFSEANFPGAHYESLLPALRLASRLVSTDC